jgi:hypothetical protein
LPLDGNSLARRRGSEHRPLYILEPRNPVGTFRFEDSGVNHTSTIDFIAVDAASQFGSSSTILTTIGTKPIWSATDGTLDLSDHLPVEAYLQI